MLKKKSIRLVILTLIFGGGFRAGQSAIRALRLLATAEQGKLEIFCPERSLDPVFSLEKVPAPFFS